DQGGDGDVAQEESRRFDEGLEAAEAAGQDAERHPDHAGEAEAQEDAPQAPAGAAAQGGVEPQALDLAQRLAGAGEGERRQDALLRRPVGDQVPDEEHEGDRAELERDRPLVADGLAEQQRQPPGCCSRGKTLISTRRLSASLPASSGWSQPTPSTENWLGCRWKRLTSSSLTALARLIERSLTACSGT